MRSLTRALDTASATRSRIDKVAAIATALAEAAARGEGDLAVCARILAGRLTAPSDGSPLGVGGSIVVEAASLVRGVPEAWIAARARQLGDLGDAVAELVGAETHEARRRTAHHVDVPDARQLRLSGEPDQWTLPPEAERHRGLPLRDVAEIAEALARAPARESKTDLVAVAIARTTARESRYFVKALLGELRVGVRGGVLEEAIAKAFDASLDEVRAASTVETDPGALAILAARGTLAAARARVFSPIAFMLASPEEDAAAPVDVALTIVEDKLDGVRAQLHVEGGVVRLFARGQGDVAHSFPEIVAAFRGAAGPMVLDGEVLAISGDQRPRPFQALQARLGRTAPEASLVLEVPVRYFAFDILMDGESLLAEPWQARRERLEARLRDVAPAAASVLPFTKLSSERPFEEALSEAYDAARARGHEGVVIKRVDAPYEAGRRGAAWRKVKRAFATLDVVVTAAERGHGRRAAVLSDYTFGVWRDGELVDVGRAYSGLTDAEIASLTERIEALTVERRGALHKVKPSIVLEVAFDGVQRSKRHPSGFALRFPRIARIRDDKRPEDANDIHVVEGLFAAQVASGHREEEPEVDEGKSPTRRPRRRRHGGDSQMGLFAARATGDDE